MHLKTQCTCSMRFNSGVYSIAAIAVCVKLLLMCAEFSTDMDVHAHWTALVYNLPLSKWYTDTSSQWTLDYPPLFAYFEYAISFIAALVNPEIVAMNQRVVSGTPIMYFLRLTVIATDPILVFGALFLIRGLRANEDLRRGELKEGPKYCRNDVDSDLHAFALVLFTPALLLVDNVHFQYNGLPLGVLLLSLGLLVRKRCAAGVVMYGVAVNLKHTLIPLAPALAMTTLITLIRRHRKPGQSIVSLFLNVSFLVNAAFVFVSFLSSLLVPWIPLWVAGGRGAVRAALSRLFPFKRGLLHAYWAANFWAVYAAADLVLRAAGFFVRSPSGNATSGIIGAVSPFSTLPNVSPQICAGTVLSVLLPVLALTIKRGLRNGNAVIRDTPKLAAYAALASFVFGWHVHEKNILVVLLPLAASMGVEQDETVWVIFILLAIGGQFGVFPLVTGTRIAPFKLSHFAVYIFYAICLAFRWVRSSWHRCVLVVYALGTCAVEMYSGVGGVHSSVFGERFEFLPLLIVSMYSCFGVLLALPLLFTSLSSAGTGTCSAMHPFLDKLTGKRKQMKQ